MKTYQILARAIGARARCEATGNFEWLAKHQARINAIIDLMPSGSGYNIGTKLDDSSKPDRIVLTTAYHHMNDCGMYDGWTHHNVIVTPSLEFGFNIRITGRDRNGIKEMMMEDFHYNLNFDRPEYDATANLAAVN